MNQERKQGLAAVAALLLGSMAAGFIWKDGTNQIGTGLVALGNHLRQMSLAGGGSNLLAWLWVIAISLIPAAGLFWKGRKAADWLLLVSSLQLFAAVYFLVNPTLVAPVGFDLAGDVMARSWALLSFGCVIGTMLCWVLLRIIGRLNSQSAALLPRLLLWTAIVYAFLLGFQTVQETMRTMAEVTAGNTDPARVSTSNMVLIVLAGLELIPNLLAVWVILLGGKLASALDAAPFAEETVSLAERISGKCIRIAKVSLLLTVAENLLQMLLFSKAANIHIQIYIPIVTLVLCAVLTILCKYFRKAKDVSDDNAAII